MMAGNVVNEPCPISAAGDTMVMVPSVAIETQTFAVNAASAAVASPTRARGSAGRVSASVRPATDSFKKSRRLRAMASGLPRGALDGADDAQIGAAAADVAVHVLDDLRPRRILVAREQLG